MTNKIIRTRVLMTNDHQLHRKETTTQRTAIGTRAISIVAVVIIIVVALSYVVLARHTQVGSCQVTTYFLPDTEYATTINVTTTSGNTTTYFESTSIHTPTTETMGSRSYATTTNGTFTTTYVVTSTFNISPESPSADWAVTVCTFVP
jgi:hypothetical protein